MYFAKGMHTLDIILPAYNPLPGWESIVINRFLSLQNKLPGLLLRLILVNDGSVHINESESVKILKEKIPELTWISYTKNKGKGHALRQGILASSADFILYTDIDWPYTEDSMIGLIQLMLNHSDVVIGIRDEAYYQHLPKRRRQISRWLRFINGKMLHLKVNDTQAGLKGFRKKVKDIFLATTINRYLFDLEFIYLLSAKKDLEMIGYPVSLRPGITFSKMNKNILFQEARNFLKIWLKS